MPETNRTHQVELSLRVDLQQEAAVGWLVAAAEGAPGATGISRRRRRRRGPGGRASFCVRPPARC